MTGGHPASTSTSGCERCLPDDAAEAWRARRRLIETATLLEESHHRVALLRCGSCAQGYVAVFAERIDWVGGDDPQHWTTMAVTAGELAHLAELVPGVGRSDLEALPRRRSLVADFPAGSAPPTVYWSNGIEVPDHD